MSLPTPYYDRNGITIYCGDCREILPLIPDKSVDLLLTDPPYGITSNQWDKPMAAVNLWLLIKPIAKTYIFTAGQPYSSSLVLYGEDLFKHEWIWVKNRGSNFANTIREPMKEHEHILVFSEGNWVYNPQFQKRNGSGGERVKYEVAFRSKSSNYRDFEGREPQILPELRVPSSIQFFNTEVGLHPTQKPLALFIYLVKTYSNPGNTMIDPFAGSGTTLKACQDLGRKCIGIEIEEKYCEIAVKRLSQEVMDFHTLPTLEKELKSDTY